MTAGTRKLLRDIRIGEMLVFSDGVWAVLEDVQPFPSTYPLDRQYRRVTLAGPNGVYETTMRAHSYWDVSR